MLDTLLKYAILSDGDEMMLTSGSVADINQDDNQRNSRDRGRPMVYLV
jgi:hypothetical protein